MFLLVDTWGCRFWILRCVGEIDGGNVDGIYEDVGVGI